MIKAERNNGTSRHSTFRDLRSESTISQKDSSQNQSIDQMGTNGPQNDILQCHRQWLCYDVHGESVRSCSYGLDESRGQTAIQGIRRLRHSIGHERRAIEFLERVHSDVGTICTDRNDPISNDRVFVRNLWFEEYLDYTTGIIEASI